MNQVDTIAATLRGYRFRYAKLFEQAADQGDRIQKLAADVLASRAKKKAA